MKKIINNKAQNVDLSKATGGFGGLPQIPQLPSIPVIPVIPIDPKMRW